MFEVGQRWSFHGEAVDAQASIVIGRIVDDPIPKGSAIHVWIEGLGATGPDGRPSFSGTPHTPISREALERSVDKLLEESVFVTSQFEEAYETWRAMAGSGVWTTTIAAIIEIVRKSM